MTKTHSRKRNAFAGIGIAVNVNETPKLSHASTPHHHSTPNTTQLVKRQPQPPTSTASHGHATVRPEKRPRPQRPIQPLSTGKQPLKGKVVAVSALHSNSSSSSSNEKGDTKTKRISSTQDDDTQEGEITQDAFATAASTDGLAHYNTYNSIRDLCIATGATVSSQVHRNVDCVVVTESACRHAASATQRVRKAWAWGVPVVLVEWVHQCLAEQRLVPLDNYCIARPRNQEKKEKSTDNDDNNETDETKLASKKRKKKEGDLAAVETTEPLERKVDLGCCCVCHELESVSGVKQDCEWCVDCRL